MALTAEDKARLSASDQQKLNDLTNKWNSATTQEEKESLQAQAKAIRENSGYTSNQDGTYKADLPKAQVSTPSANNGTGGSSGSGSGNSGGTGGSNVTVEETKIEEKPNQGKVSSDEYSGYTYSGTQTSKGAKGQAVSDIQTALNYLGGYNLGTYGENQDGVDGSFGGLTTEAIKAFQKANGLKVDGIVGPQTGAALEKAVSAKLNAGKTTEVAEETKPQQENGTISKDEQTTQENKEAPTNTTTEQPETIAKTQDTTVYRISGIDAEGNVEFTPVQGTISYDANGGGHTSVNGGSLQNGDAVQGADGTWWFYDSELGYGVPQEQWEEKYADSLSVEQAPSSLDKDSMIEELFNMIFNEGTNQFLDNDGNIALDDFLTWYEAQALAQEKYNPLYNQALKQSLENIDKQALQSGFYGQLPTEALKNQAVAETEAQRTSDILDLANELVGESRDTALDKLNAALSARESDLSTLAALLQYAEEYETGSNAGTSGMKNNGKITFNAPDGTSTKTTEEENSSSESGNDNNENKEASSTEKKYDNGSLTDVQVKELQNALGFTGDEIDGKYGPNTKSKAGNLTADEAYKKYVTSANSDITVNFNEGEGVWTLNDGTKYTDIGKLLRHIADSNTSNADELSANIINNLIEVLEQHYSGTALDTQIAAVQKQLDEAGFDIELTK